MEVGAKLVVDVIHASGSECHVLGAMIGDVRASYGVIGNVKCILSWREIFHMCYGV